MAALRKALRFCECLKMAADAAGQAAKDVSRPEVDGRE